MRNPKNSLRALVIVASIAVSTPLLAEHVTIPPAVYRVWPVGFERGSTATFTIEGRNLTGARVLFDSPALTAKVLSITDIPEPKRVARPGLDFGALVPEGVKQEAKIEITATKDAEPGVHRFRFQTALGTSNLSVVDVGSLPEVMKKNSSGAMGASEAQSVELPATLIGTLAKPGEADVYEFAGKQGEEMVFQVVAQELGSSLKPELTLRDASGKIIAQSPETEGAGAVLAAKLPADAKYQVTIADREKGGSMGHFYRLNAGALPYVTGAFPLGARAGQAADVAVWGVNLGGVHTLHVSSSSPATLDEAVKTPAGYSIDKVKLAVGGEPEIAETEPNNTPAQAQPVTLPVTINGHIDHGQTPGAPDEDYFRFHAAKGQRLIIEVNAARLGSPLDSVIEVLDAQGHEVPRATIRCLAQTSLTLSDRDSGSTGFRLLSLSGLHDNDYLMAGEELVEIESVPDQPDEDVRLKSFEGQRIPMLDTSAEVHTINEPVYKVKIEPPDAKFPPNGLPVFHLTMRNDDGGPGFGRDSRLDFTAPADGDYLLHLRDVRGIDGPDFAYRLTLHPVEPDFTLSASPENPNVPRGGRVPVEVTANRLLGYNGPIDLKLKGLPAGVTVSDTTIPAGQWSATLIFQAADSGPDSSPISPAAPFEIEGRARIDGREVTRVADSWEPLRVATVVPPPDVVVSAEPATISLEPGKTTTVTLHVVRKNGFTGRVPCYVRNLPPGVSVDNVGLNGVLVTEDQTSRTFTLRAEDWAWPLEQPIYVVAEVESNSPTAHASAPLALTVRGKPQMAMK